MADTIYLLAQAETSTSPADAVQHGTVVVEEHADAPAGEVHATTEDHGGEVHATVFPPFDATTFASQILWFAITFAALYVLMSRVAIPQIGSIIDKRKARIEGDLKEAERLRVETERAAAAYEEALAEARANAHAIAEETRQGIRTDIEGKRAKVESDLSAKVSEAEARIAQTKTAALSNVQQIAADTAAALVAQLSAPASEADVRDAVATVAKG